MEDKLKNTNKVNESASQEKNLKLDDERRVKVLSPGMLVFKRFMRNKLAIAGLIILLVMFLFSFPLALVTPYGQAQVFKHNEAILKEYASAIYNSEYRYCVADGNDFGGAAQAQATLAISKGKTSFTAGGNTYGMELVEEGFYTVNGSVKVGSISTLANKFDVKLEDNAGFDVTDDFVAACKATVDGGGTMLEYEGVELLLIKDGKMYDICKAQAVALASLQMTDAFDQEEEAFVNGFDFRFAALTAKAENQSNFTVGEREFYMDAADDDGNVDIFLVNGDEKTLFGAMSDIIVSPVASDVFVPMNVKNAIRDSIIAKQSKMTYPDASGTEINYQIDRVNTIYYIKTNAVSELITMYAEPSADHFLGTDKNGMDVITRLMYGGRISLMIGFVVVIIETFLGVILGGVSGYFGGWVDTAIMRFVDLFNCIPFYPMVMIIGSAMDKMEVDPEQRIFILMGVLGILGWTGIARIVRGQILSLREQDFMVATEATGIRVSRRIFRHLVPNVMPLLIVNATMNLGGIIISEATLSFLGLGVKYPLSSWGSMIQAASDIFVLTNYWFIWIPAGICIVLTVLGFNFVGDGLRDAFDPKMKR